MNYDAASPEYIKVYEPFTPSDAFGRSVEIQTRRFWTLGTKALI